MKKVLSIIFVTIILLSFSSCKNEENIETNSSNSHENDIKVPVSESSVKHENPRTNYTKEEAVEIIDKYSDPKLKVSEDFSVDAPKKIDHVSTFLCGTTAQLAARESIEDFRSAFNFLFPNHDFDENCFYYVGPNSSMEQEGGYKRVAERYKELVSGEEEAYLFFYDESDTEKEDRVALTLRSPFGSDITTVNKGAAHRLAYHMGLTTSYGSDIFTASRYFTYVGSYSPDSEEVFKLSDKEISVKDAVVFFENYVNSLPCLIKPCFSIHVNDVQVYKVDEDLYCYNYTTSKIYDGIPFDYAVSGSHGGRGNRDLGIGEMIKSNDVDYIYGTFKTATVMDEKQFSDIISFEKAVTITSEKMTDYVEFEVKSAQLVYCTNDDIGGSGKLGETKNPVFPAWKLMLYNPNDNCSYSCYVNVLSGDFESYRES